MIDFELQELRKEITLTWGFLKVKKLQRRKLEEVCEHQYETCLNECEVSICENTCLNNCN